MLSGQISVHGRSPEAGRPHRRGVGCRRRRHRHHGDADGRRGRRDRRRGEPVEGEPRRARRAARRSGACRSMPVAADASTDEGIATVIDQVRRHRRRSLRAGQRRRRCRTVDVDAVDPGDARRLARAVHREPGDGVLHEPGGGRPRSGATEARVDRLDLVDQRHEHRAVPHRLRHRQGRGRRR